MGETSKDRRGHAGESSARNYIPLVVLVVLTGLAASARQVDAAAWSTRSWMHDWMGFFLVVFSMFKLFDLRGFAEGFEMYDLLAGRFRPYAYVYPFLELSLGLGYLSHLEPKFIYAATVVLMSFGAVGVIVALRRNLDVDCACLGSILKVPLSTVALIEDLGMAAMAAFMLATAQA